jgi:hypothetical protein
MISTLDRMFLQACQSLIQYQQPLLALLAHHLDVSPEDLYYAWMEKRCQQTGMLPDTPWHYYFHGLECDFEHMNDNRYVRVEFGPRGRLDTCSGYGVLQFVMTSTPPWQTFPTLRDHLAEHAPPYDQFSGSYNKMYVLWQHIVDEGLLEAAAPDLVDFVQQHTEVEPSGAHCVRLPDDTDWHTFFDCGVCDRKVISAKGWQMLQTAETEGSDTAEFCL